MHPKVKTTVSITDEYEIRGTVLGAGTFSECREAVHKATGRQYAVKIINKSKQNPYDELEILVRYGGHQHILTLRDAYDDGGKV